jgi:hypothetical protein
MSSFPDYISLESGMTARRILWAAEQPELAAAPSEGAKPRAVGVECVALNGELVTFRANEEVLVACGAIASPQLLQCSGVGPSALLGRLGVPSAVGPLVDALETQHVVVSGDGKPEGSTSATFTPSGGGLSMGGGPKRSTVSVRNDRVLEALVALTGTNFEWDARGWRVWLATRHAPPADYDPRRG